MPRRREKGPEFDPSVHERVEGEKEGFVEKTAAKKKEQAERLAKIMNTFEDTDLEAVDILQEEALEGKEKSEAELERKRIKALMAEIDFSVVESLPEKLAQNKDFLLMAMREDPSSVISLVPEELRKDEDFLLRLAEQYCWREEFIPEELRGDDSLREKINEVRKKRAEEEAERIRKRYPRNPYSSE